MKEDRRNKKKIQMKKKEEMKKKDIEMKSERLEWNLSARRSRDSTILANHFIAEEQKKKLIVWKKIIVSLIRIKNRRLMLIVMSRVGSLAVNVRHILY